ncbi:MAG: 4'-phosphopantetheinyl transferase superfamily protein [Desulfobacula sp.]|jgi:4'-phosphopantetheinyl transferase|uniref:4'-phosphopantetheinyl transferase family protein n=2 Tax=Desulfobacula sp. TaxID=2593537 RepID=UPI001D923180|nr:4'-phosphopantetheinyl transferase superfamily protein [Desulfobacula sp.]MBT7050265.1 4'-phosphopantetheinyl transferase superfamily protein [Desulfobacula sp.]
MGSIFQNKISINTLSPQPGIMIWYAKIPEITRSVFKKDAHPDLRAVLNELFKRQDFIKPFLSHEEINTINGFKALKKQIEWISGRYLIKQMIQNIFFSNTCLDQINLSYRKEGAPFLTTHPDLPVSLSHSNDYTAAACCKDKGQTIGLDIEKIAKAPDCFFMKTAFTQNEILNLKKDAAQIFRNWTIKEAYLKYIKKGFNESLQKVEVINNEIFHNKNKINVNVFSTFIDTDYVLSLVSD